MELWCKEQVERYEEDFAARYALLLDEFKDVESMARDFAMTLTAVKELGCMTDVIEWRTKFKRSFVAS